MDDRSKLNKIYPISKIPVLQLEDQSVWAESGIIVQYLDRLKPGLFQVNDVLRGKMLERILDLYVTDPTFALLFEKKKPHPVYNFMRFIFGSNKSRAF